MGRYNPARKRPKALQGQPPTAVLLDAYGPGDIKRFKEQQATLEQLHWRWYTELAGQRSGVVDALKQALSGAAIGPFTFDSYQRAVKYYWSLNPLSMEGSLKDPGGRFNIGAIDLTRYPASPALYAAEDRDTAIQELLGGKPEGRKGLSASELSLTAGDSLSVVALRGSLESVLDLGQPERLKPFVEIIRGFRHSSVLDRMARNSGIFLQEISTIKMLTASLLAPDWRKFPVHVDVPASSQIFGNLVEQAGIEAILYPSKHTKKKCLAIYPGNFVENSSFVELIGSVPPQVSLTRLDGTNGGRNR